jgi:hypothetical protein
MKPGHFDLPIIWRGSSYPEIRFTWLDSNGDPMNLDGWTPRARTLNIDLHPEIINAADGVTAISFNEQETANLKLGIEQWDWVWEKSNLTNLTRTGPLLSGRVEIRDPVTPTQAER